VTELVLDASVVLKWFRSEGERHPAEAQRLREAFAAGDLIVFAPQLLGLELLNVAGRRWGWDEAALVNLGDGLDELGFEFVEPDLARVAHWTARGLTAYDASYVAVAEAEGVRLVTDDELLISLAPDVATALAE
jgi:predicted nucleic acid-binding protein